MLNYHEQTQAAEQYGAVKIQGLAHRWRLMVGGVKVGELSTEEITLLAAGLAHRLEVAEVVPTPCGIEGRVGAQETVWLCYSDQAEQFAKAVMAASGLDEVAA